MTAIMDMFTTIVGIPQNDVQTTFLYMCACTIAPILIYYILYIVKLMAHSVRDF